MKKKIFSIMLVCLSWSFISLAQPTISNKVINSAGGEGTAGTTTIYYNIGETVINTINSSSNTITQGFLQPDVLGNFGLSVSTLINHISCVGKTDGAIVLTPTISGISSAITPSYQYFWTPTSLCPANDCQSLNNLNAGVYSVTVIATFGTKSDTVEVNNITINDSTEPCLLEIFNGVTPNGDNKNDFFFIGNIDQYPKNNVKIFTRWGQLISNLDGYDNVTKRWDGNINGQVVASGTYFYVIDLGNGSKPIKGWIELLNK
ncbi:MAG: gliding motility-associated C-terminal domain-containing protein [Bacteroidia bacterium]|nr:gliding motility-associated C-terminal domain-containing protein [Bacteroidia bacterium]